MASEVRDGEHLIAQRWNQQQVRTGKETRHFLCYSAAEAIGRGLAQMGLAVVCGGRQGVMEAVCKGAADAGGVAIGMLPEADPASANPYVGIVIATGIGEARNALIARSSLCLVVTVPIRQNAVINPNVMQASTPPDTIVSIWPSRIAFQA